MNKVMNALSYTGILFFLPIVVNKDAEGRFHANQGLIALILQVIFRVVGGVLGALSQLPLVGGLIGLVGSIFGWAAWLVGVAILIFGIVNVINGVTKPISVVGKISLIK